MTHNLVVNYGLFRKMDCFRPKLISAAQMTHFHSDDYINFLRLISPGTYYFVANIALRNCNSHFTCLRQHGRLCPSAAEIQCG